MMTTAQRRVLLIDDSATDRQFLEIAIRRAGLDIDWQTVDSCTACTRHLAAIAAREEAPPELVVLDQRLDDGLGSDLLPALRQSLPEDLPVVVFSTSSSDWDRQHFAHDPHVTYLVKPHTLAGYDQIIEHIRTAPVRT
ncbi:MAG: response regulator [Planctomycetota bacterium]